MNKSLNKYLLLAVLIIIMLVITICNYHYDDQETTRGGTFYEVKASQQTVNVRDTGDAADDPAIWIHPEDPQKSLIIGTNKKRGLAVYMLNGQEVDFVEVGRVNNVDVTYNYILYDSMIDIVGASNRSNNSITIMWIHPDGRLEDLSDDNIISGVDEVYGFCFYRDKKTDSYYAIVNSKSGMVEQWQLYAEDYEIQGKLVRSFEVGGQTEGCVVDAEHEWLYIGQEDGGIWRYHANPEYGDKRTLVDDFSNPQLAADIEGLSIYFAADGKGYLIASSQGNNTYAIYDRIDNHYIGSFKVIDAELGGTEETDGIDVINLNLGPLYPNGFFIAQDGYNYEEGVLVTQNFKMVPWERIANSFDPPLIIDNSYNPRD